MDVLRKEFCKSKEGRKYIIDKLTKKTDPYSKIFIMDLPDRIQEVNTPYDFCKKCIKKTIMNEKKYLVCGNLEFIEFLIEVENINPNSITFIGDTKLSIHIAKKIYKLADIRKYQNLDDIKKIIQSMLGANIMFDLVFSNPPYNKNLHLDIISELYKISNEMIIIHPQNWALDLKNVNPKWLTFKTTIGPYVKSLETISTNKEFNIPGNFHKTGITHIDKKHHGQIDCNYYGNKYKAIDFNDVSKFGSFWKTIQSDFIRKIKAKSNSWLVDNILKKNFQKDPIKVYCQLSVIIGTPSYDDLNERPDFYTIVLKNPMNNIGIRKKSMHTFKFNNKIESKNFCNFLSTNFARFCLCIYKIDQNLGNNEMQLIPWLNFKQSWDDNKLFSYFNIDIKMQTYINNTISKYHI